MIVKELSEIVDDINRHIIGIKEAEDNIKFKKATVKPIYKTKEFWVGSVLIVFILSILVAMVTLFTEYKFFVK